jgi:general secretion pathway protein F
LATLVGAGFPLVSALDALIPQTRSKVFKKILVQVKDAIVEGNSFAGALSQYTGVFSSLYINMVRAGETSGTLEIVLAQLADITEKQQALKGRIRTALAYPVLMMVIGALVLFLLLTFIVPTITSIFSDMNQVLPTPTRLLIAVSNFFKSFWWVILIGLALLLIGFRSAQKTTRGRYVIDRVVLLLPLMGPVIRKLSVARFARTLGSLLKNGVTMLTSMEIVKNIAGNALISSAIEGAAQEVSKGQGLGVSLGRAEVFPDLAIQMIQVGEQSGELEQMLDKMSVVYENEAEASILSMTSLLEPLMILFMGLIMGFIVLSICLPIFEMNQLVG